MNLKVKLNKPFVRGGRTWKIVLGENRNKYGELIFPNSRTYIIKELYGYTKTDWDGKEIGTTPKRWHTVYGGNSTLYRAKKDIVELSRK